MSKFNCSVKNILVGYSFRVIDNVLFFSIVFYKDMFSEEVEFLKPISKEQHLNYNNILYLNYGEKLINNG